MVAGERGTAARCTALNFLGYLTQRIYAAGPLDMFHLPDLPDAEAILTQLEQAKLIVQYSRGGVRRWERAAPGSPQTHDEARGRG